MNRFFLSAIVACSVPGWPAVCAQPIANPGAVGGAPDALKNVGRKIGKEPAYGKSPKYCLAVFGAEAKFRVWLVLDGEALYVDLNGNGDLTEKGERSKLVLDARGYSETFNIGDLTDPHNKLTHKGMTAYFWGEDRCRFHIDAAFENSKLPRLHGFCDATFASKPADAPVVHFGGPLKMGMSMATADERPAFVVARVGTPGVGKGTFVDYSRSVFRHLKGKLQPHLELETPGEKNAGIREADTFYTDSLEESYLYPVSPGAEGDKRQTKMTLSFPDWKDGHVAPSSFVVPVVALKK